MTLLYSLPSLLNIGTLVFLAYFIFAVLGVFLFSNVPYNTGQSTQFNDFNNFDTFGSALLTLFRACTGEKWQYIMFDVGEIYNIYIAYLYFVLFYTVIAFIML